jgi:hypothetical protein
MQSKDRLWILGLTPNYPTLFMLILMIKSLLAVARLRKTRNKYSSLVTFIIMLKSYIINASCCIGKAIETNTQAYCWPAVAQQ